MPMTAQSSQNLLQTWRLTSEVDRFSSIDTMLLRVGCKGIILSPNSTRILKWSCFQFQKKCLIFTPLKLKPDEPVTSCMSTSLQSTLFNGSNFNTLENMCACAPGSNISQQKFDGSFLSWIARVPLLELSLSGIHRMLYGGLGDGEIHGHYNCLTVSKLSLLENYTENNVVERPGRIRYFLYRSWCIHTMLWKTDKTCWKGLVDDLLFDSYFWVMHRAIGPLMFPSDICICFISVQIWCGTVEVASSQRTAQCQIRTVL